MTYKAPGKHYRKGISLVELFRLFPDEAMAEDWFTQIRWPKGLHCPYCGSVNIQSGSKHKTMPYLCRERECAKRFSVRTGSPMQDSNIGYKKWAIAIYLLTTNLKGVSSMKLHRDLEITQKSAWHLSHRIREAMKRKQSPFSGPVEVDETFIGGKEKNKHARKKLNAGRGTVGKTAVIGAKDRKTNRVSAAVVENVDQQTLHGFIFQKIEPGARVYTDDHGGYFGLSNHQTVRHSVKEYVNGQAHTNGIESFWALLKRGYYGTYHRISPKHLGRYVSEFERRHNIRESDTVDQMEAMVRGMSGKRLRYKDLIS